MKILIVAVSLISALTSCGSKPVTSEPANVEIIGEWECSEFPRGFVAKAGSETNRPTSIILIQNDGSFSARSFPQREPYRYEDFDGGWELADPSITPSGSWSIEFQGNHLQCRRDGSELVLRYTIDGMDEYSVEYTKKQNKLATPRKPSD